MKNDMYKYKNRIYKKIKGNTYKEDSCYDCCFNVGNVSCKGIQVNNAVDCRDNYTLVFKDITWQYILNEYLK